MVDLKELEALLAKATPGPWARGDGLRAGRLCDAGDSRIAEVYGAGEPDAELILFLRNNAASLIQRIRELERVEAAVKGLPVISVDGGHTYLHPGEPGYDDALAGMVLHAPVTALNRGGG